MIANLTYFCGIRRKSLKFTAYYPTSKTRLMLKNNLLLSILFLLTLQLHAQDSFKKDILYLTSEELEGRSWGTKGDSLTQEYISNRFSEIGLTPFLNNQSYLQEFDGIKEHWFESTLQITKDGKTIQLKDKQDYCVTRYAPNRELTNQKSVFVGYGLNESCLSTVKDKIVFIYAYNKQAPFNYKYSKTLGILDLEKAGATAIISISPEDKTIRKGTFNGKGQQNITILHLNEDAWDSLTKDNPKIKEYESIAKTDTANLPAFIDLDFNIDMTIKRHDHKRTTANIIGLKKGKGDHYIIIGAHHDHLGRDKKTGLIYPGANDNASGVAMLLNLAEKLESDNNSDCNLLFIAFAREEGWMIGSKYFIENSAIEKKKIKTMINLDVIGQLNNDSLFYGQYNKDFQKELNGSQINKNLKLYLKKEGLSDHIPFHQASIPTLYFNTGNHYKQLHKVEDKEELINYDGMAKTADFLFDLIKELDKSAPL